MSSRERKERGDCWLVFLCGTVVTHLLIIFLCPRWALQPRPDAYWFFVGTTLFFLTLPCGWSVYLVFAYRNWRERIVAYVALVSSLYWLTAAWRLVFDVLRMRMLHGR